MFASDKHCAEFGGIKLFVEDHEISRAAAAGETVLLNGTVNIFDGGAKGVRIKLRGTAEGPCADILDGLLTGGTRLTLTYGGMVFENVFLAGYKCEGKSGCSEKVSAEFIGESAVNGEVVGT